MIRHHPDCRRVEDQDTLHSSLALPSQFYGIDKYKSTDQMKHMGLCFITKELTTYITKLMNVYQSQTNQCFT